MKNFSPDSPRILLLGAGELGKEFVAAAQKFGAVVFAADRYDGAPAMQNAQFSRAIDLQSAAEIQKIVDEFRPDFVVPEIEAINTKFLIELENRGVKIVPTARAVNLTMDREGIRKLAADELNLKTAKFAFAENFEEFQKAVEKVGIPAVVKPVQSSSGKGQSTLKNLDDAQKVWKYAIENSRGKSEKVIVEEFIEFESEITLLTVRENSGAVKFCPPVGHVQKLGDYRESWQPHGISPENLEKCEKMAAAVVGELGGVGLFGAEFFIGKDEVYFSEISPRPHDTGLVTLISQNISEFEIHARAIFSLPIPEIKNLKPAASAVVLAPAKFEKFKIRGAQNSLKIADEIRIFGKPSTRENRRMAVVLASGENLETARENARAAAGEMEVAES